MAMSIGSVTVANDGTYTGSGMTKSLLDAFAPSLLGNFTAAQLATVVQYDANGYQVVGGQTMKANALAGMVPMMQAIATGVINHIIANAVVAPGTLVAHVTTQSLGVTPNPNNAATAIVAPASPVDVPVTGAGVIS